MVRSYAFTSSLCVHRHVVDFTFTFTYHRQWRTQEFLRGGVQQTQLRTEDRENGDLGAAAP